VAKTTTSVDRTADVGILSSRLLLAFQKELFRQLAREGHAAIRPKHGAVLAFIDRGGTRAIDLAQRSGQHKQVIGTLIDELEDLGYVTRQPDPADRRAKLVVPTDRGLDEMAMARRIHEDMEARYAAAVGPHRYRVFKKVFAEVASAAADEGPVAASPRPGRLQERHTPAGVQACAHPHCAEASDLSSPAATDLRKYWSRPLVVGGRLNVWLAG
jgi:DNA-binding MarR family transcriptional regulator